MSGKGLYGDFSGAKLSSKDFSVGSTTVPEFFSSPQAPMLEKVAEGALDIVNGSYGSHSNCSGYGKEYDLEIVLNETHW